MITAVANDLHLPAIDPRWQRKWEEFLNKERPEQIILAGDIADIHALSSHRKDRNWVNKFHKEIESVHRWLQLLRELAPRAEIQYIIGNHELRIENYLDTKAPELSLLELGRWDSILGLADHHIRVPKKDVFVPCGQGQRCLIRHGHEGKFGLSKFAGGLALRMAENLGCNVMCGHTHKLGMLVGISGGKLVYGYEGGFGAHLKHPLMGYVKGKRLPWAHAFTYFDSEQTENPFPNTVKIYSR